MVKRRLLCLCLMLFVSMALVLPAIGGDEDGFAPQSNVSDLVSHLASSDRGIRSQAAYELRHHGQSALPVLLDSYRSGSALERRGSIVGIALMPRPALGMDTLLAGLADEDKVVRSLAAQGLALVGRPAAPALVELLARKEPAVRDAAGFSLRLMGGGAVPALIKGLESDNEYARAKAAWLLGRMGEDARPAIPALINALDVVDARAMHVVAEAVDLIGPDPAMTVYHLMSLHAKTGCPASAIGGEAAPLLIRLLSRPGTPLAQLSFHALALMGQAAVPALKEGAAQGPIGKQVACALVLLEIDPGAASGLPEDVLAAIRFSQRQPKQ